jgi:hypothetical protein
MSGLSRIFVVIIAVGVFLLVFTGLVIVFRLIAARQARRKAEQQVERGATEPPTSQSDAAEKRKAVKELLGDALEQGHNLQKGMYLYGERLRYAEQEDVKKWVDRTHDFIQDAFGKPDAQRFLSREGYTDEELLGRKPHPKLRPHFLNDRYFVKARLKRLDELSRDLPEIDPDFNPESYPWDWIRR